MKGGSRSFPRSLRTPSHSSLPNCRKVYEASVNRNHVYIDEGADFNTHIARLIAAVDYYIGGKAAKGIGKKRRSQVRTKQINDPLEGSLDNYIIRFGKYSDAREINLIARGYYPQELVLPRDEVARWLKANKGTFRVALKVDERGTELQLVGYCCFLPLRFNTYEKLKNHEIDENSIKIEDIQPIYTKQTEAIYVLDLSKHQEENAGAPLLRDMVRYLSHLTKKNPAIKKIGTWAFSRTGQEIASRLGMDRIRDYEDYEGTSFYEVSDPAPKLSAASEIEPDPRDNKSSVSRNVQGDGVIS